MKFNIFNKNKSLTDEEMVLLYQKEGDLEILGELYNRYLEMMYGVCLKYLKNTADAEDTVMQIFEIIMRRIKNHNIENFSGWLYRVAANHCLDILRKKTRDKEKENEIINMQSRADSRQYNEEFQEISEKEIQLQTMEDCIQKLKAMQKDTIQLFYLKKNTYEEVAEKLGITWSQTRSYVQNGRRNLKKCMEEKYEASR